MLGIAKQTSASCSVMQTYLGKHHATILVRQADAEDTVLESMDLPYGAAHHALDWSIRQLVLPSYLQKLRPV
jgi:hypothetical protein